MKRLVLGAALLGLVGCQSVLSQMQSGLSTNLLQATRDVEGTRKGLETLGSALGGCPLEKRAAYELDAEQEYAVGRTVAARQLAELDVQPLAADHPVARYVDRVGQYVALVAEVNAASAVPDRDGKRPERALADRPWPLAGYRFLVLPTEEPRATASPGGTVMVSYGLLRELESEEELAAVLAHEVSHLQRGHGVEVLKAYMCQSAAQEQTNGAVKAFGARVERNLRTAAGGVLKTTRDSQVLGELLGSATDGALAVFKTGYPEAFELEADRMAVRYTAAAGYAPDALRDLFQRLRKQAAGRDQYFKTHPSFDKRIATVEPRLAALTPAQRNPTKDALAARAARFKKELGALPAVPASGTARAAP